MKIKSGFDVLRFIGIFYTALGSLFAVLGGAFIVMLPQDVRMLGIIFMGIGSLFAVLGIIFLVIIRRRNQVRKNLVESGQSIWADVVDCEMNYAVRINHVHPSQVIARYTDYNGVVHLFKSENIRSSVVSDIIGQKVRIYCDGSDFKHYYMDVEPLLKNYIMH